jgi:hypothetical protein
MRLRKVGMKRGESLSASKVSTLDLIVQKWGANFIFFLPSRRRVLIGLLYRGFLLGTAPVLYMYVFL